MTWLNLLCAVLVVLKLAGVIELSWILVLAPIWVDYAIGIIIVVISAILSAIFKSKK